MVELRNADPTFILPILAAIFTFASTYLSSMSQIESNASMKIMNFVMPVMILVMGVNLASGLSLYWVVSNAFQVVQTLLINNPFKIRKEREEEARRIRERERALKKAMNPKKNGNNREVMLMPIYEAATIDEAVQLGLADLGLAKDQVEIEILEEGKKGFLGMGRKNARLSIQPSISEKVSETVEQTVEEILEEEPTAEIEVVNETILEEKQKK